MIEISHLSKNFETKDLYVEALKDINLTINDGSIFGIIGLSGAGKSTLLRTLVGLEKPSDGSIYIDDVDITKLKGSNLRKYRSNIGVVFQGYNLLMQRNVWNNLDIPLRVRKIDKEERKNKIQEIIKLVGLEGKEKAYPANLSGGQKQRVAIARALVINPKILLLDEPTSALDSITTKQILKLLKDIHELYHITVLIITHEISVVSSICHQVAVINDGEIVEKGEVLDIFNNPQCDVTKLLLGKEEI